MSGLQKMVAVDSSWPCVIVAAQRQELKKAESGNFVRSNRFLENRLRESSLFGGSVTLTFASWRARIKETKEIVAAFPMRWEPACGASALIEVAVTFGPA
jgi:hypothetical protein